MTASRVWVWGLFVAIAIAQAFDSGVHRSTPVIQALVAASIALPALALLFSSRTHMHIAAVVLAAIGLFAARVLSPVPLGRDLTTIIAMAIAITATVRAGGPSAAKKTV